MSQKRNALGRGLGALISSPPSRPVRTSDEVDRPTPTGDTPASNRPDPGAATAGPREIPIARIDPNPEQPRRQFDPQSLEQLARSIAEHGVLQPVLVRQAGERFELVMGERRFRASQRAGRTTIPAVVVDVEPGDRLELAIIENVQRQDLNPIELALAFRALAEAGSTQEEIGRRVSLDRSTIANHLRLLDLGRPIQEDIEAGRLTMGHAKALLQVADPARRESLRRRILAESLSVRATERAARDSSGSTSRRRARAETDGATAEAKLDADTRAFVDRLQRRLQTRVKLHPTTGGAGRIEIEYSDLEELERLGGMLLGEDRFGEDR